MTDPMEMPCASVTLYEAALAQDKQDELKKAEK